MYAVVDIETTGGSPVSEKITEIAVYVFDGERIVDEYVTLINPEKKIPYHITQLTGISNSMVAEAPKFYEIARDIVQITEEKVFVAHNATFDYNFIKQEFKRLGYNFHRNKICTVNLSRRLIPGKKTYSLGKLCAELSINIKNRHRAAGDALATVELLKLLLKLGKNKIDFIELPGIDKRVLHPNLNPEKLKQLPTEPGVYYFYNENNDLIYIGKSINIHSRVLSHFRNFNSKKAIEMMGQITDIDYELTGNELIALLKESFEIKQLKPYYNRAQRRAASHYGIYSFIDNHGYIRFEPVRLSQERENPLITFASKKAATSFLDSIIEKYNLCQKLCGIYSSKNACFHYEIMECKGACIGKESPENYNQRAQQVINTYQYNSKSFYIIEKGRAEEELAVVKVKDNQYLGYGYLDRNILNENQSLLDDCIKKYPDDRDTRQIIRHYLHTGKPIDLIRISSPSFE